jgi:NAD(P)-dependent dehydrogenase (short-subunit alcohol dehydrogenase family)
MTANQHASFAGKVAFVTGAAGGIGRAAALAFAREGASVVVADVSEQDNQETARMIEAAGGQALAIRCDVTRAEDVKAALDTTIETFGRLDAAFNNAGVEQAKKATADLTEEEWDRIIGIDLRGMFLCMKYEIPLMLKQGGGASASGPCLMMRDTGGLPQTGAPTGRRGPDGATPRWPSGCVAAGARGPGHSIRHTGRIVAASCCIL